MSYSKTEISGGGMADNEHRFRSDKSEVLAGLLARSVYHTVGCRSLKPWRTA